LEFASKLPYATRKPIENQLKLQVVGRFHRNVMSYSWSTDHVPANRLNSHEPHRASISVIDLMRRANAASTARMLEMQEAQDEPRGIIMSGYLDLRKPWTRKWRTMWFEIDSGELRVKSRDTSSRPKRVLSVKDCTWMEYNTIINRPCFSLLRRGHDPMILCCKDAATLHEWRTAIELHSQIPWQQVDVNLLPSIAVTATETCKIIALNAAAEEFFGYKTAEVSTRVLGRYNSHASLDARQSILILVAATGPRPKCKDIYGEIDRQTSRRVCQCISALWQPPLDWQTSTCVVCLARWVGGGGVRVVGRVLRRWQAQVCCAILSTRLFRRLQDRLDTHDRR
jgi:hypothetical protein